MTFVSRTSLTFAVALAMAAPAAPPALAQAFVQPLPGTTDADRLAEQMRLVAANPNDVAALTAAGELSLRLDDLSGAASLFARADKADPRNGRVKAGMASVLVRSERPGEALRYFSVAEGYGVDARSMAADRALAYDLVGEQERAQRDYRVALRAMRDDETVRRYALSLGIAGKRDLALEQLDPLLRKSDRGAWRARAFILAMGGDQAGAERIAATMMPPGAAEGLQPFFVRLPTLSAADRAFAVHFGEIHATPERLADARMAPPLPALGPDPTAPVQVAAVVPQQVAAEPTRNRRSRDRRQPAVPLAAAAPPAKADLPPPPVYRALPTATSLASAPSFSPVTTPYAAPRVAGGAADRPLTAGEEASLAAATGTRSRRGGRGRTATLPAQSLASAYAAVGSSAAAPPPAVSAPAVVTPAPVQIATVSARPLPMIAAVPTQVTAAPATQVTAAPVMQAPAPSPIVVVPATVASAPVANVPGTVQATPRPIEPTPTVATTPAPTIPRTPPVRRATLAARGDGDQVLARIIAGLSVPASELEVAAPPARAPKRNAKPIAPAQVVAEAKAKEDRDADAEALLAAKASAAADKKAADRKADADRKALAAKKAAKEKELADARAAAEEKKAARANPTRIWVQVAGGANADDLPKAWEKVRSSAPDAFAGRRAWTTPLRATNRVLTGPFKTDAEARAYVNQLKKAGVAAFSFTSDAGQKVEKLPAK